MTLSIDVARYADPQLDQVRGPVDMMARARTYAPEKIPGFQWLMGSPEEMFLEAGAVIVSELVYAIRSMPSTLATIVLGLFGIQPDAGAPSTVTATVTIQGTTGGVINQGFEVDVPTTSGKVRMRLDADVVIAGPGTFAAGQFTASSNGSAANGVPSGTQLDIVTASNIVESVVTTNDVGAGREPEGATEFLSRGLTALATRNRSTLILPIDFQRRALEDVNVLRAKAVDLWDGATTTPGHISVYTSAPGGVALTTDQKNELQAAMQATAHTSLTIHVLDRNITNVNVTGGIVVKPGYDAAQVQAAVIAALQVYLDPDVWGWGATVYYNELISFIDQVDGVERVDTISTPASDLALTGPASLVRPGTIVINPV